MDDQVQFLTSKLLTKAGVKHGWFMRYGGVSKGLFESLNGKKGIGDEDSNVEENRKRACHALNLDNKNLTHILHDFKTSILETDEFGEHKGYDASISTSKAQVLSQTTADCGTVIISNTSGSVISIVHGSWHTLKDKIISDVATKIKAQTNEDLLAGIGPMICKNCYEFGAEAATLFDAKYLHKQNQKYLVDLKQMIIDQLYESGVTVIDDVNICTLEDQRFFSHRKNGAKSGRFLTIASFQ